MALTDKQKRFCEEYVVDLNATQAAIRSGYSENTANRIASENLSKLDIQEYISELQETTSKRLNITKDEVLNLTWNIAQTGGKDTDKLKAAEIVNKMLGFYEADNKQKQPQINLPTKIVFTKGAKNGN